MENEFHIHSLLATIVFGSVLIAIIYHGIVYIFIRDYLIKHYILFLFFFGVYTAYVAGFFEIFFGSNLQKFYQQYIAEGSQMFYLFFYNLFVFKAMNLDRKKHPLLFNLWNSMVWIIFIYGITITAFVIFTRTDYHNYIFFKLVRIIVFAIAIILILLYTSMKANLFQKIIFYGSIVYLLFGFVSTYINFYTDFHPFSPLEWLVLGGFVDIIFFSAALNYRIRKTIYNLHKNLLSNANEKLKIKDELLQKQHDLENERSRIAMDMHDDLGSGLTKINYLAQTNVNKCDMDKNLEKIKLTSSDLIENMSNIIWAMKQENDSLQDLLNYIKIYAYDYLETNEIELKTKLPEIKENTIINGHIRRNTFLIIKEILHNMVKHSRTKKAEINIRKDNVLHIEIGDFGIGFDCHTLPENKGNGLDSMKKRVQNLHGEILCTSSENGTKYKISIPVDNFPNKINRKDY